MSNDPDSELNDTDGVEVETDGFAGGSVSHHVMTDFKTEQAPANTATLSRWKENHGSLLLFVFAAIVGVGFLVIWYQQTRFVPPRFPDGEMIQNIEQLQENGQAILEQENMIAIRIAGAPNNRGSIKVAIHANPTTFNSGDQSLISQSLELQDGEGLWLVPIENLPNQFAVAAYHDENNDQQLTLNRFGIPTERYGFSREARGLTGPPNFLDAVIERPEPGGLLFVFLR